MSIKITMIKKVEAVKNLLAKAKTDSNKDNVYVNF